MSTTQPQIPNQPVSNSTFYMWRCIIAIAHADGTVQPEEYKYIERIIANMDRVYGLSDEQKQTFEEDFKTPQNISDLLPQINDPQVRAQLIYFGGLLAHADGVVTPEEDAILKKLHADQMAGLDMDQIRKQVSEHVADEMFHYDIQRSMDRPQKGWFRLLDAFMLRLGIDLMENDAGPEK
ncbi:MAG: hypothetical protein GC185_09930 [Alphaproteobacteria bacterium]|nr:hypothetical protein [Alphaproteobacteria bacterium]